MRHRSLKQQALYRERVKKVKEILEARPLCEACETFARHDGAGSVWQRPSEDVHELIRRSQGGSILDDENLMAVCRPCHTRITLNPKLGFDLGLALQGWAGDEEKEQARRLREGSWNS